ncbi:MAG: hypothetical protein FVQ85_21000 [Planctomycetes bacterium]|nr:hypothetical protein [Planctomycetota bacterium]
MKPEFKQYLNKIGATQPIQERVEHFWHLCSRLAFQPLMDIFIDEYPNQDKTRVYDGLMFYSRYYTFAIPYFLTSEDITILAHYNLQDEIRITVKNFDFRKTNKDSLMNVELSYEKQTTGSYKASQENCIHLVKILRRYVKPYLYKT